MIYLIRNYQKTRHAKWFHQVVYNKINPCWNQDLHNRGCQSSQEQMILPFVLVARDVNLNFKMLCVSNVTSHLLLGYFCIQHNP